MESKYKKTSYAKSSSLLFFYNMPSPDDHKTVMPDDYNMGPAQQGGGYDDSANTRNAAHDTAMRQSDNMGGGNTNMNPMSGDNMNPTGSNTMSSTGDQTQSNDTQHTYGKNAADKIESMLQTLANKITGHKK